MQLTLDVLLAGLNGLLDQAEAATAEQVEAARAAGALAVDIDPRDLLLIQLAGYSVDLETGSIEKSG